MRSLPTEEEEEERRRRTTASCERRWRAGATGVDAMAKEGFHGSNAKERCHGWPPWRLVRELVFVVAEENSGVRSVSVCVCV